MIYFDYNASAPMLPEAKRAWLAAADELVGNASSPHRAGRRAEAALENARNTLARLLGGVAADFCFTSGATEGANAVLQHLGRKPDGGEIWVTAVEHPAVLAAADYYFGNRVRRIPVDAQGVTALEWLEERLRRGRPAAIAVMSANNETGVLQPSGPVLELARKNDVPLVCDATQSIGRVDCAWLAGCDYVIGSAHKFGGPKGLGFMKCPGGERFEALLRGGPQEEGRRAGTENVPGVISMLAALEKRQEQIAATQPEPLAEARDRFEEQLAEELPGSVVLGNGAERLWNTSAVIMPESDCRFRWVVKLDKLGFAVSTGSACASGKEEPSHVLQAMGIAPSAAGRALRFSSGWETTGEDWNLLLNAVRSVHASARALEEIGA